MIKDWPRKLTFAGLGVSIIIWTSGMSIVKALEPDYCYSCTETPKYDQWQWVYDVFEARYPLAIAIAVTAFGA